MSTFIDNTITILERVRRVKEMNFQYVSVKPAYGRNYNNKKEILADWNNNKDFMVINTGSYINKEDYNNDYTIRAITFYYGKFTSKVFAIYKNKKK